MKVLIRTILSFIFCLINLCLYAQQHNTWYAFGNPENGELIGFKDKNGDIRILPTFIEFMQGWKFDHIMGAIDMTNDTFSSYYLTKSGRMVGCDSLFFFDNMPDCENEGFIRFHDKQADKAGIFNRYGDIVIPAEYNVLTNVRNGLIAGLGNAEKQYWHTHEHEGCNHYSWVGGEPVLLDTANQILVRNFNYEGTLDFYSLQITDAPVEDTRRLNFKSVDSTYFSFICIEDEFRIWLNDSLLTGISKEKLLAASYDRITWTPSGSWEAQSKYDFIAHNFDLLASRLLLSKQPEYDYYIISGGLNQFIFDSKEFEGYYNNCGNPKDWLYPVISLILNHRDGDRLTQDHFDFL